MHSESDYLRHRLFKTRGRRSWYSGAAWYFVCVCNVMHHESGYLRHRLEIMVFSCSMVLCARLQWNAPWHSLFKTQAGFDGIQLQHDIVLVYNDMHHESGYLRRRLEIIVFSCSMVFCTCLQWLAPCIRLVKTRNGDHGVQLHHGILYLFAMTCTLNQVI